MLPILIIRNFNPRAPYGARPRKQRLINAFTNFNPRAPYGARPQELFGICLQTNFNPRAPYGARLDPKYIKDMYHAISIHAPHTGRDETDGKWLWGGLSIFQSTRPIRGATRLYQAANNQYNAFQSTRPIRGATLTGFDIGGPIHVFQSTRPIRGATSGSADTLPGTIRFQSTRPIRGATHIPGVRLRQQPISIHAPHTGRDGGEETHTLTKAISIHAPHTGRDRINSLARASV